MKNAPNTRLAAWFRKTERPFRIEWIALGLFAFLFLISYTYGDIIITTRHGMRLWDCLFQGRLLDFYNYNSAVLPQNSVFNTPQSASYDFTVYLIFALWNLPLWALEQLFRIPVTDNFFCLIWPKLLLVLAAVLSAGSIKRIARLLGLGETAQRWAPFVWCSSALVCSSLLMISQYDIFSLFFMLLGFEAYLKLDTKKFLLFFAIATSCKYFALLVFLPLVLLRWKKVWQILLFAASSFALTLFWKALFLLAPSGAVSQPSLAESLFSTLTVNTQAVGLYPASLFFVAVIAVCIFAYSRNDDPTQQGKTALYVSAASMLSFVALTQIYPYWSILVTPFLVLLVFSNRERLKLNLFLEMGFGLSLVFQQMNFYSFSFSNYLLMPMLWGKLFGTNVTPSEGIGSTFYYLNLAAPVMTGLSALMLCCAAGLLLFNTPKRMLASQPLEVRMERSVIWVRVCLFALVGLLPIASYLQQLL